LESKGSVQREAKSIIDTQDTSMAVFKRFVETRIACEASVIVLSNCDFPIYGERQDSHAKKGPPKHKQGRGKNSRFIQLTALLEIFNCDFE
jgi:hypothetical protein